MTPPPCVGTITPSANRVVERALAGILRHFPGLDSCVARIPFHGAGIGQPGDGYDHAPYIAAATQLAHARADVICWNGSRGAGLGLDADRTLCAALSETAGRPATTAALAARTLLDRMGARLVGVVTPSAAGSATATAAGLGRDLAGVAALGLTDNLASAWVGAEQVRALAREAARGHPDAILLWSTNLEGWHLMAELEAELGLPVIDAAAAGVWGCLDALGVDPAPAAALGRVFATR